MQKDKYVEERFGLYLNFYPKEYAEKTLIEVPMSEIMKFDPTFLQYILEHPEDSIYTMSLYFNELEKEYPFHNVRLIPYNTMTPNRSIQFKAQMVGKLILIEGYLQHLTSNSPFLKQVRYFCDACNIGQTIDGELAKTFTPVLCPHSKRSYRKEKKWGTKQKFTIMETDSTKKSDYIKDSKIEETKDTIGKMIFCEFTHIDFITIDDIDAIPNSMLGKKLEVLGILKCDETTKQFYLDVHNYKPVEQVRLSEQDREKVEKFLKDEPNAIQRISNFICKRTYKHNLQKKATFYACINLKRRADKRKDEVVHIAHIGDPSTGKTSTIFPFMDYFANSGLSSGKGITAVGLCGGLIADEKTGKWEVSAGMLSMCDNSFLILEEMDSMDNEIQGALHTAMSDNIIPINKGGKRAIFRIHTPIIISANPKKDYFDPALPFKAQIQIDSAIFDRIALPIFYLSKSETQEDRENILYYSSGNKVYEDADLNEDFIKKIIARIKEQKNPEISEAMLKKWNNIFMELEQKYKPKNEGEEPLALTNRQRNNMVNFSKIIARCHLKQEVTDEDIQETKDLFEILQFNPQYELLGTINQSIMSSKIRESEIIQFPESKEGKFYNVLSWLKKYKQEEIPQDEIEKYALGIGCSEFEVKKIIEKLHLTGDIFKIRANSDTFMINRK